MFSDEEIKEIPDNAFSRPGDEIISIHEVCLSDKYDKKDLSFGNEALLLNSSKNDLDVSRSLFRDVFPEGGHDDARFAWTEEDGNIAALVSEPGFCTTGQTTFGKDLDAALKNEMKEADTSSSAFDSTERGLKVTKLLEVPSSTTGPGSSKTSQGACKVDKADPRSRFHYVKYVKRHGRTVKLWECGICSREFQHQYTLTRHLPTHTDERNFHCMACGKSFRQLSTLSQHRAIHSAERPYSCEMCNKTFNRVSTLISHRKTHSDEKPYRCHLCPKGFHQKGNLRNHLFTHTNERPYRCNICFKGFNQQSNLVCHKNKAHPEDSASPIITTGRNTSRINRSNNETQPDSTRPQSDQCEVSSSVGPYLPSMEDPSSSTWSGKSWEIPKPFLEAGDIFTGDNSWGANGVIVEPIKTYHMGVALATRQTPFALLQPDNGAPVLVKVVDAKLPGGKQMLVPATAEDLRIGGKIVLNDDNPPAQAGVSQVDPDMGSAVQIRVPVVATVVPRIRAGGRLHLAVEEPHYAYHTALSADGLTVAAVGQVKAEPNTGLDAPRHDASSILPRSDTSSIDLTDCIRPGGRMSASCALPPPAPSPPLDLIPMDLFEPMECIPLGPQITPVDIDQAPPSDDSDIFIGKFEESIPLSDSD